MQITKHEGLVLSTMVLDTLINLRSDIDGVSSAHADMFTNGRENGLVITLFKKGSEDRVNYWVSNHRNSDSIQVVIDEQHLAYDAMYTDAAYKRAKTFRSVEAAVNHISLDAITRFEKR